MPCAAPLEAYRPAAGGPVRFQQPRDGRAYIRTDIPCGQCILCRLEHARQWAVRITHEAQRHERNSFITLTYADEHLPEHNSLNYEDLQNFWKRLRHHTKVRYYSVGEYGDQTQRPHYHACVFGEDFTTNRTILRQTPTLLWTNRLLEEAWGKGNVSVGALNFTTAQYTAAYVTKKLNRDKRYVRIDETTGELIALEQPRALMSRRPGIGSEWVKKYGKQTYDHDHIIINGQAQKPPKYYDTWLQKEQPAKAERIKEKRRKHSKRYTEEQNRARARNAHARAKQKSKTL